MTPIQQHEAELRAMVERAGLVPRSSGTLCLYGDGVGGGENIVVSSWGENCLAAKINVPQRIECHHPDPRIALRHCLEMAGLIRPPVYAEAQPQSEHGPRWRIVVTIGDVARHGEWQTGSPVDDEARYLRALGEAIGAVDRPPVTDEELRQWLVERAGPCDFMDRWSYGGYTIRRLDSVWVFWHTDRPLERSIYARELGAILWCAERFL